MDGVDSRPAAQTGKAGVDNPPEAEKSGRPEWNGRFALDIPQAQVVENLYTSKSRFLDFSTISPQYLNLLVQNS